MKQSMNLIGTRFAEISFLMFLLVLATRASYAKDVTLDESVTPRGAPISEPSAMPVSPLSIR